MSRADFSEALHVIIETQCLANAVVAQSMHSASRPNVSRMRLFSRVCTFSFETQCLANAVVAQSMYSASRPNVSRLRLLLRVCTLLRDPMSRECGRRSLFLRDPMSRECGRRSLFLRDPMSRECGCCSELVCKYSASRPNVSRMRLLLMQSKDATIAHACRDHRASRVAFFPSTYPAL